MYYAFSHGWCQVQGLTQLQRLQEYVLQGVQRAPQACISAGDHVHAGMLHLKRFRSR